MKTHLVLCGAVLTWLTAGSLALALDTVKLVKPGTVNGRIQKMSPTEVEIEATGGSKTIPINEIEAIFWDSEPSVLKTARQYLREANYQSALQSLEKINVPEDARPGIKQDVAYYTAYSKAQMALAGQGDIMEVGREMNAFLKDNADSYHWLEGNEVVGDLLVAAGNYEPAVAFYARLGQTPWPDYKMRSAVAMGRTLLAQNQVAKAEEQFDAALRLNAEGELASRQKSAAILGKARCLASVKKTDEAIKTVEGVISRASPDEDAKLLGEAYAALGNCYRAAGKNKEALYAFLHVDLIYHNDPDSHAEALFNLVELWKADSKPERAAAALQLLDQRYPKSLWNKKAQGA